MPAEKPWWGEAKSELPKKLKANVGWLQTQNSVRAAANLHHLRLYSNRMALSLSGESVDNAIDGGERIKMNVIKSAIDAAVAQIATNRPRPMFMTENGDYSQRKRAERLGRFVYGQFHKLRQYEMSLDIFQNACIWGTGFEKIYHDGKGQICIERILPDEILVDHNECRVGRPKQMFHIKNVSREVLLAAYPKQKRLIEEATCWDNELAAFAGGLVDPVTIVEAWKLPSGYESGDGRHVLSLDSGVLCDDEYKSDSFPIVAFRWNTAPIGFFGVGAAEELAPIQLEINYIAQKIQQLMTLATSMIWKEKGSFTGKITNENFAVREFQGKPPIFQTTASVSGEYFTHLDRLYNRAYEIVGISQLQASSKKPGGLDSGAALRIYNDIGTRRFQHVGQRWEQFHLDVAERLLEVAKEIDEAGFPQAVLAMGDREVEQLNFEDVNLDREVYVMKIHPVSIIPDTPAGKLEVLEKLAQAAPTLAPRLVTMVAGIPDLEAVLDLEKAPQDIVEKQLELIMERGVYEAPTPYMDLELARNIAQKTLLRAEINGLPEARLELLRSYISDLNELQKPPAPPQPMPPGPPGMPGAPPPAAGQPPAGMPSPPPGMPPGGPVAPPAGPPPGGMVPPGGGPPRM